MALTARVLKRLRRKKKHSCGRKDCWILTALGVMYYVVSTGLKLKLSSNTVSASKGYL